MEKFRKKCIQILVISDQRTNYYKLFEGLKIEGKSVLVEQANWGEIKLNVYEDRKKEQNHFGCIVELAPKSSNEKPFPNTLQHKKRTITVDFVLIRNLFKTIQNYDHRNILFGLMYAGVPSINNLYSTYCTSERVLVHGEMKKIQNRIGKKNFPLIPQHYHSCGRALGFSPKFPCVIKVSGAHSGFGKMIINNPKELRDLGTIVSLHKDYSTSESYIKNIKYELRLQKIGTNYRAMKKELIGNNWKSNQPGACTIRNIPVSKKHKQWLDECSKLFHGLDIFALDVLNDGEQDYILELNDCSIGLSPDNKESDNEAIKHLCIQSIKEKVLNQDSKFAEYDDETDNILKQINTRNSKIDVVVSQRQKLLQKEETKENFRKEIVNIFKYFLVSFFSLVLFFFFFNFSNK